MGFLNGLSAVNPFGSGAQAHSPNLKENKSSVNCDPRQVAQESSEEEDWVLVDDGKKDSAPASAPLLFEGSVVLGVKCSEKPNLYETLAKFSSLENDTFKHRFVVEAGLDNWRFLSQKQLSKQDSVKLSAVFQFIATKTTLKLPQELLVDVQTNAIKAFKSLGRHFGIKIRCV